MIAFSFFSLAFADIGQSSLVAGTPECEGCLDSSCATSFYHFLTHCMMEQGFVIESRNMLVSSLIGSSTG